MARLYEWEVHLTDLEQEALLTLEERIEEHKGLARDMSKAKDAIRRKAVQRARNALNKQARAAMKGKTK